MDHLSKFNIPFVNLSYGIHRYEYLVENKFFEAFENSVIQNGEVKVVLDFDRQENMLVLNFDMKGFFELECDRCLEKFNYPVDESHRVIIKFAEQPLEEENDDDIITISTHEHTINVAQHLYDFASLIVPIRKVHPNDKEGNSTCNPEFLEKIEGLSHHEENHNDPRWEALKKLRIKN